MAGGFIFKTGVTPPGPPLPHRIVYPVPYTLRGYLAVLSANALAVYNAAGAPGPG